MRKFWICSVLIALGAGLTGQFVWKMIYWPEPLVPVIFEVVFIWVLVASAMFATIKGG